MLGFSFLTFLKVSAAMTRVTAVSGLCAVMESAVIAARHGITVTAHSARLIMRFAFPFIYIMSLAAAESRQCCVRRCVLPFRTAVRVTFLLHG